MRRTLAATLVALSLAASMAATPSYAAPSVSSDAGDDFSFSAPLRIAEPAGAAPTPVQALERAEAALEGEVAGARRPEASLAMRDLFTALPSLTGDDRTRAEGILARPTDGANDPQGDGYTVRSKKKCGKTVCIHWVPTTADAPPSKKWINKSLRTVKQVWKHEVGKMGYRRPAKDGGKGGPGGKLDVYLKDVGSQGLYGYCAPEFTVRGKKRDASGYCVLDNDFSKAEFGAKPINSLRVTAAHEFFHAVQFAYDYNEDPWFMEATATWMEERFADAVNDNRQYLPQSHLAIPGRSLDTFDRNSTVQYGNWIFFEYLGQRYGHGFIKKAWQHAGGAKGKTYSISAVNRALPRKTSFKKVYSQFAAANATPGKSYSEGRSWPMPTWAGQGRLGKDEVAEGSVAIDHLANAPFKLVPAKELSKKKFKLRVSVDGPKARTSPAATIVWQRKSGKVVRMQVKLNKAGNGSKVVAFNRKQTKAVYVVATNASTRYNCGAGDFTYACRGVPKDDGKAYGLKFKVVAARR